MANPSPPSMRDVTKTDNRNSGYETIGARDGQKIVRPFGNDRSTVVGSADAERDTPRGLKGSPTNLAHSLAGTSANQRGSSR